MTDVFKPLDKTALYAAALDGDIRAERYLVVEDGRVEAYWAGTVYGAMVATDKGFKFKYRTDAKENAQLFVSQCQGIVNARSEVKP